MKMDRNLFLAILSMDSYNRGYGQGTTGLAASIGTQIGSATIKKDSNDEAGISIAAGFYAIAYNWRYGDTCNNP
jgi:hypothetical protein